MLGASLAYSVRVLPSYTAQGTGQEMTYPMLRALFSLSQYISVFLREHILEIMSKKSRQTLIDIPLVPVGMGLEYRLTQSRQFFNGGLLPRSFWVVAS